MQMFHVHVEAVSFASASVQYCRPCNLNRAWRGVKCATNHDAGRTTSIFMQKTNAMPGRGNGTIIRETLGERMRFVDLDRNELVYKERFIIRSTQIGANKTATIEAIASILQDTSANRVQRLGWTSTEGFPTPPTMKKHRLSWIASRAHIEMYKYPVCGDVVEVEHWTEPDGRIAARLDFIIRNISTGEVIGRSRSKWLIINLNTRKLHKLSGEVWEEFLAICTKSHRLAFPEKNNPSLRKIPMLNEPAEYCQLGLMPRRADLDMNEHVNNVTYYSWLLQSIPDDIVKSHELEAITIDYRRECHYGSSIDSLVSSEAELESINVCNDESNLSNLCVNSEGRRQFLHLLKFSGTNCEISLGRTVWRKKEK